MITETPIIPLEEEDKILGTPSAQNLLRLFFIWERLTTKEIKDKIGLSEGQIFKTLNNLLKIKFIVRKDKGVYQLSNETNIRSIQEAYRGRIISYINTRINEVHFKLREGRKDEAHDIFHYLGRNYEPLVRNHFAIQFNSLVHRFLEKES